VIEVRGLTNHPSRSARATQEGEGAEPDLRHVSGRPAQFESSVCSTAIRTGTPFATCWK
jgi:hypothetical protein